nr:uncharacterized protein LOC103349155 isoform X1 [Oryctolagus cuniculus]
MGTSWGGTDCRSPKPSVSPVAPASLSRAGQEVSMAAPGARAEKAVRWDRGCLHGGRRKGCHCEMEPAGVFQLWRLCLQGRGNGSAGPSVLCTGALLSCLRWLYKVQDQRIPETRSAPARRLPVEGPLGGHGSCAGGPWMELVPLTSEVKEGPGATKGSTQQMLQQSYVSGDPRLHDLPREDRLQDLQLQNPCLWGHQAYSVLRPRCPNDRTSWLLWLPPGHHDRPQEGGLQDAQLENANLPEEVLKGPGPRCPKDRSPWLLWLPQVIMIIHWKTDSKMPSFRILALPEKGLNVPRPCYPTARTPCLLWLPPGQQDHPSTGRWTPRWPATESSPFPNRC